MVRKMTDLERAYLAGFFDGEGCIGYYNRGKRGGKYYHSASIVIGNTDPRVMTWIMSVVGVGNVKAIAGRDAQRHTMFQWEVHRQAHLKDILQQIEPLLVIKREQVQRVLALWELEERFLIRTAGVVTPELEAMRQEVVEELKNLKTAFLDPIH